MAAGREWNLSAQGPRRKTWSQQRRTRGRGGGRAGRIAPRVRCATRHSTKVQEGKHHERADVAHEKRGLAPKGLTAASVVVPTRWRMVSGEYRPWVIREGRGEFASQFLGGGPRPNNPFLVRLLVSWRLSCAYSASSAGWDGNEAMAVCGESGIIEKLCAYPAIGWRWVSPINVPTRRCFSIRYCLAPDARAPMVVCCRWLARIVGGKQPGSPFYSKASFNTL